MNKKLLSMITAAVLSVQLTACVTHMGMTASSTPLEGKKIESNLGESEGTSDFGVSALGLWTCTQPDIDAAIKSAVSKKEGGDALINVRWYEVYYYALFVGINRIVVKGDVVRFAPPETEKQAGKPAKNR